MHTNFIASAIAGLCAANAVSGLGFPSRSNIDNLFASETEDVVGGTSTVVDPNHMSVQTDWVEITTSLPVSRAIPTCVVTKVVTSTLPATTETQVVHETATETITQTVVPATETLYLEPFIKHTHMKETDTLLPVRHSNVLERFVLDVLVDETKPLLLNRTLEANPTLHDGNIKFSKQSNSAGSLKLAGLALHGLFIASLFLSL